MSEEFHSTGLASLDNSIDGGGLRPGTVIAIRSPGRSVLRRLAINLCADRPVHYVALGGDASRYEPHVRAATGLGSESVSTRSVPLGDPFETLTDHLDGLGPDLPDDTTVVVDPTTPVESQGERETAVMLGHLRDVLDETGGLGIVLTLDERAPDGQWVTTSRADAVFSVTHRTSTDSVRHHLAVDRLPMGQQFRDDAARTFELPADLSMSLDTSKSLSP